jgi:MFS family permease
MPAPEPASQRLGIFRLAPGWTRGNAASVWFASLTTIGLAAFLSIGQPYLLNEVLQVPATEQGRLTGALGLVQELIVIALAGFVGAWSDRTGRRPLLCLGLVLMGAGYVVFPFAGTEVELVLYRLLFAVGVAMAPLMMQACVVDAIEEQSRARWVGSNNLLQGLGVALVSFILAASFGWFQRLGATPVAAGRYGFWCAAVLALVAAGVLALGLPRGAPLGAVARRQPVHRQMGEALRLATRSPVLAVTYGAAFIGRGDFTIIGAFLSLWITQAGIERGMTPAEGAALGGRLFGTVQLAAVGFAFFFGMLTDRIRRITGLCVALALATTGYVLLGTVADPFGPGFVPIAVLVGMGEVSVIVASSALLGQEAPRDNRGPVIGFFNAVGGLGILFATGVGGIVFDTIGRTAPFTMMGLLNLLLLVAALAVRARLPAATPAPATPRGD